MEAFLDRLRHARERLLILDYDGTLAPFAWEPSHARPYPEAVALLDEIMSRPGDRVAIVTGRNLRLSPPVLPLARRPELWGEHGWQREVDGALRVWNPPPDARATLSMAAERARGVQPWGARVERKGASIAVHWRGATPAAAEAIEAEVGRRWAALPQCGLQPVRFDGGIELRACARHKGVVVRELLGQAPGETAAAYLGDDRTDEDAFDAIAGRGLSVLVRPMWRPTRASTWLTPPEGLLRFLRHWRDAA